MTNGAAHDTTLHIASAFVGGDDTVADQKRCGADVVGNHAQGTVFQICTPRLTGCGFDQRIEQIDFVIAVHMLQDGRQALQAHAGIDTWRGQWRYGTVFCHIELHEDVVPDFNETVAVFFRAARGATRNVRAMIVKNFAAWTARAGVSHHPEVIALVASTFVVTDTDDTVCGQADFFGPNIVGLVVFFIDGGNQALFGQLVDLGQQFPSPLQAFTLEIVTKTPVAEHFEEGVVAGGIADVF